MKIIIEEMNFRKKMCEYAKKHGGTRASREYHTNRKLVTAIFFIKSVTYV